ncbi:MarR family winged helix-turn-helix transcriptional regulator [Streptomyces sp. NPDC051569]|uniref:MarR family winged helix-turn-helix transcriptional regulator n=1 Tax=Streptomyces sp. NPDC051569 TaxID=3365661 RepID=UPI00378E65C9
MTEDLVDAITAAWRAEMPAIVGPEFELIKRVARLHHLLEDVLVKQLAPYRVTKAEYDILSALRSVGKPYRLRPTDLSERLLLTSGGTSNALRKLAAAELIEREPDPEDARSSWVRLTPLGIETAQAAVEAAVGAQLTVLSPAGTGAAGKAADDLREVLLALGDRKPHPVTRTR